MNTSVLSSFTVMPLAVMPITAYRQDFGTPLSPAAATASRAMMTSGFVPLAAKPHRIPWITPCLGEE